MSKKRKQLDEHVHVLLVLDEQDGTESSIDMSFVPTKRDRLLLELNKNGGCDFFPDDTHGAHYEALTVYLARKYGEGHWTPTNPISSRREDEESDDEVLAFIQARRKKREKEYDYILFTQFYVDENNPDDLRIYEEYIKKHLSNHLKTDKKLINHLKSVGLFEFANQFIK